ncbi:related to c-module-binding factor [Ustilago trichophora]|uniref:Related to c-module-binding factor n=1 Tax=Ustilago trichophora TaxID=86804 RepID=A0A5C3E9M9_9BASI|nr:related to c-module-binding factor [Ustilago trichophora]
MSYSHFHRDSDALARAQRQSQSQSHTHASQLPQQQQQQQQEQQRSIRPPVSSRPHPSPRRSTKSAALSAIATLPASSRSPTTASSSFLSPSSLNSPASPGTMPSNSTITSTSSFPNGAQAQAALGTDGRAPSGSSNCAALPSVPNISHRSASGSLDRIASLPVSNGIIEQETGLSSDLDAQRGAVARSPNLTKTVQLQNQSKTTQATSSSKAHGIVVQPEPQSPPIVPSQVGSTVSSPVPRSSQPDARAQTQASPPVENRPQPHIAPPVSGQRPTLKPPQSLQPPVQASTASPNSPSRRAPAPPRSLSHVTVTQTAPQTSVTQQVQSAQPSQTTATSHKAPFSTSQTLVPALAATISKPQVVPLTHGSKVSQTTGTVTAQTQSPALAKSSPKKQPVAQAQAQAQPQPQPQPQPEPPIPAQAAGASNVRPLASQPTSTEILPTSNANTLPAASPRITSKKSFKSASSISKINTLQAPPTSFLTSSESVNYGTLTKEGGKFKTIPTISCLDVSEDELEQLIRGLVEAQGEPLIISDLHKTAAWSSALFNPNKYEQLRTSQQAGRDTVRVRNLTNGIDQELPLSDFLARCEKERNYSPGQTEKLYGNALPCPPEWAEAFATMVHPRLEYHGDQDIAASLVENARSATQKCFFGPGRTGTPLHRELCSGLGQNLMVWSDSGASSIWMITDPADADAVERYIASKGADPLQEKFAPHPNELQDAPFPIFSCQQTVGDLVLIPSRAMYMVINTGGRTMNAAWSRMTVETLASALTTDLPLYQRYCREESYHVKPVIEETLIRMTEQVEANFEKRIETPPRVIREFRGLLQLYDAILTDEFLPKWREIEVVGGHDSYVECDFCGADVLHGYFECPEGETFCALCYCQGRLCGCPDAEHELQPRQHWRNFGERLQIRNDAAQTLLKVRPTLAVSTQPTASAQADDPDDAEDDDEELPLREVEIWTEDAIGKKTWPFSFMAAYKLYSIRQTPDWRQNKAQCKICKATLDISQRYDCKPCRHSYCYGCLLHKMHIHPVHALAQNDPDLFHRYHRKNSTLDYKEWKQDPLDFNDEARAHFALIEAAKIHKKCTPINKKCRIGFLDVSEEHPHGLSGTLGVKQTRKAAVDKVQAAAAQSSSASSSTTPVSRKRQNDLIQSPSTASPKTVSNKKAKLDTLSNAQPMEEDEPVEQILRPQGVVGVPILAAAPVQQPRLVGTATTADVAMRSVAEDDASSLAPTLANGIRKFVLRKGQGNPVSPVSTALSMGSSSGSSPSSASFSEVYPTSSKQSVAKVILAQAPIHSRPAHVVQEATATTVPLASSDAPVSAQPASAAAVVPTRATLPVEANVSRVAPSLTSATASATTAPPSSSPPQVVISPAAVPAVVAQAIAQGEPVAESVTLATSVVPDEVAAPPTASRPAASEPPSAGLGSLDNMNLRVVTEILRIFSQSNQKMIAGQVEEIKKLQAKQAEEHARALAQQAQEHEEARATQTQEHENAHAKLVNEHKQALAKMEATLSQLSAEMKDLTHKHHAEVKELMSQHSLAMKDVRKELDANAQRTEKAVERATVIETVLGGLMADITRGAQLELEAERAGQSSQPIASELSTSSSSQLAPTSDTRIHN